MVRRLVVPLDGSELAERALPYAARLAASTNGEVVLVRVALAPPPARLDGADWDRQQQDAISEAEAYLSGVAEKLATRVPARTNVAYGRAPQQLLEAVRACGADGVAMATHGRTGLAHLVYGSVAETVLAESPVPVLLVRARPGEAPAAPFDPGHVRVLVPLDGSSFAESAIEAAADLSGPSGELVLVSVIEPPDHVERDENGRVLAYLDQQEEARTRDAREYLSHVAGRISKQHQAVRATLDVRIGEPAEGIVMSAADRGVDLVVMATHGRTGFRRAVLGSVAGRVLLTGSTPVMLVGPHEAHRAAEMLGAQAPHA
jgi:nucleotide-binding universal stress UspA family protein